MEASGGKQRDERLSRFRSFNGPGDRDELGPFLGRLAALVGLIVAIQIVGMVAYALIEDVSLWQGFLYTLDTVATVGSYPTPDDLGGQILKVLLIVLGVGTLFYALVTVTEFFVAGHLGEILEERRTLKKIDDLSGHHLICGFGRVGRQVASDLRAAGAPYVVIDENPANREAAYAPGVRFITARPSDDEALRDAGIARARAIVACVDSDAENIFIALTARELRPDIAIVARASLEENEKKRRVFHKIKKQSSCCHLFS